MTPIIGTHYETQGYGRTSFARSAQGQKIYKAFGGIHPGLDFGTKGLNLEVVATCLGEIVRASLDGGWGNHIELKGSDGWRRQYAHLSAIYVKVGQKVTTGTILGRVGTTGASTGVHLHYGHRKSKLTGGWEYRDPSVDLQETLPAPAFPTARLIKGRNSPGIFVWNKKEKFKLPDWETYVFLFSDEKFEEVEEDVITKIPEGEAFPSMRSHYGCSV